MRQIVQPEARQTRRGPYAFPGFVDGRVGLAGLEIDEEVLVFPRRVQPIQDGDRTVIQGHRTHVPRLRIGGRDAPHPVFPVDILPPGP